MPSLQGWGSLVLKAFTLNTTPGPSASSHPPVHIVLQSGSLNSRPHHSVTGIAELTFSYSPCPDAGISSSLFFALMASLYSAGSGDPPSEPTRTHMSVQPPPPSLRKIKTDPAACASLPAGAGVGQEEPSAPIAALFNGTDEREVGSVTVDTTYSHERSGESQQRR